MKMKNLSPGELAQQGEVEGREQFVRDNAVSIVAGLQAKIAWQAAVLTQQSKTIKTVKGERDRLRAELAALRTPPADREAIAMQGAFARE